MFCFVMTPPPPRSTLFPYTTLFRSRVATDRKGRRGTCIVPARGQEAAREREVALSAIAAVGVDVDVDRKSTRLNSSHANISYAVFCLKKKIKNKRYKKIKIMVTNT